MTGSRDEKRSMDQSGQNTQIQTQTAVEFPRGESRAGKSCVNDSPDLESDAGRSAELDLTVSPDSV